jgi:predicted PurR-regulated permease PerM
VPPGLLRKELKVQPDDPHTPVAPPRQRVPATGPDLLIRRLTVLGVALLLGLLTWFAADVLLLAFGGILLGVFLNGLAHAIARRTSVSYRQAYILVLLAGLLLVLLAAWRLAPSMIEQAQQLQQKLPEAVRDLKQDLLRQPWGPPLLAQVQKWPLFSMQALGKVPAVFTSAIGFVGGLIVVLFLGIYLAWDPAAYTEGFLHLVPLHRRPRVRQLLSEIGHVLWRWIIGRLVGMLIIGILTTLGLWWLGMSVPLALGIIATLMDFIPNIGPILSVVPAALIALVQGPREVLYVVLLYFIVQQAENYLIEPIIEKRAIYIPPALSIILQLLLYLLFGFLGLLLAMPLAAALLVTVQMLYVNDLLGDPARLQD